MPTLRSLAPPYPQARTTCFADSGTGTGTGTFTGPHNSTDTPYARSVAPRSARVFVTTAAWRSSTS